MKKTTNNTFSFFIFSTLLLLAVGSLAYVFYAKSVSEERIMQELFVDDVFPSFKLKNLATGANVDFKDIKSKIVLVNFWASWCEPCVKEFESMMNLAAEFDSKDLVLILISQDETEEKAKSFKKSFGAFPLNIVSLYDNTIEDLRFSREVGLSALPESFLLNQDRKIIRKISGLEDWDHPRVIEFIKSKVEIEKARGS